MCTMNNISLLALTFKENTKVYYRITKPDP